MQVNIKSTPLKILIKGWRYNSVRVDALHAQDPGYNALDVIFSKHTHTHTQRLGVSPIIFQGFQK